MVHILQIVLNAALSLIAIVFFIWLAVWSLKRSDDPPKLILKWIVTIVAVWLEFGVAVPNFIKGGGNGLYGLGVALIASLAMVVTWRHGIADLIANPISSLYDGGKEEIEPKPYYSIALSKRKSKKPLEAIVAVREQLAKFPHDYEGVILLATIQAEDTKDLPSAEMTLNHFCEWEKAPPKQIAAALTLLADWHLKIANDVDSARTTMQRIIEKFPGTELSTAAAQRIAHLGGVEKILLSAHDRRPVFVPEGMKSAGLRDTIQDLVPEEINAEKLAEDLAKHLEQHPLDSEAREKLAIIYAKHYKRLDLAANELEQLIHRPGQSPKHMAHWLNLFADLQVRGGADYETVRPTLETIVERFPDLPVGELARSRLNYLKLEIKGQKEKSPDKTLGDYEQNVGLKGNRIFSPRQL
ncbi:MAG TPA: tetratricopeptide repeat protein [Methylomirabilota bacterium]|nr:tetratricopeptide repeat protein [Methylomirabilota bacterium]